jgi:hypothetical protein
MQPVTSSVINEATSGYATAGAGADTVDECGLRFLMAMKQHEYLLRCLPLKQRQALRTSGIAPSHIIWALHSETETELLNAIPGLQKSQPMWDELRSLGVGWWLLKNTTALRTCVEKVDFVISGNNRCPSLICVDGQDGVSTASESARRCTILSRVAQEKCTHTFVSVGARRTAVGLFCARLFGRAMAKSGAKECVFTDE